jgi:hypothetical protein
VKATALRSAQWLMVALPVLLCPKPISSPFWTSAVRGPASLRLKNGADADLDKSVNTLGVIEGVDLSTDECGKVRGAQSNMGAVESE